jgi:hypothetical protein
MRKDKPQTTGNLALTACVISFMYLMGAAYLDSWVGWLFAVTAVWFTVVWVKEFVKFVRK